MKHIICLVSLCLMAFCRVSWHPLELKSITLLTFLLSLEDEANHMLSAIMPSVILSSVTEPLGAEEYCFAECHYIDFLCCPWDMKHIICLVSLYLMAFCRVSGHP